VREELGWPIVMTPFAQMLLTQAFLNVTGPERYGVVPDEVVRYALGRFGRPNIPIAPAVLARIEALPRTQELKAEPAMAPLAQLRARLGEGLSDEEFLLRATMPATLVDAMRSAGPAARHYDPGTRPVMDLLRRVLTLRDVAELSIAKQDFRLELRGAPPAVPSP
jgi:oxaloacetate decarboxylase alpha subunit